jgi:geranylgeranyl diphosphate synthase type II
MDDDDWRRGLLANHKKFGETTALLAGDALIVFAMETFCASDIPAAFLISGLKRFSSAIFQVIEGQSLEFDPNEPCASLEQLEGIHQKKTGALFEAAFLIPADFLGWKQEDPKMQSLALFGSAWGKIFQMLDDLQDASEGREEIDSLNILHYLSEEEVRKRVMQLREQACASFYEVWGTRASPFVRMMDHG